MTEINLLGNTPKKEKKVSPFFSFSLFVFLGSLIVAVLIVLYILFLKTSLMSLSSQEQKMLTTISKYDKQRVQLLTIAERISVIKKLLVTKQEFSERIGLLVKYIPDGMTVTSMDISGSKVSLELESGNLSQFNTFFNTILPKLPEDKKAGVKKIDILSFSVNPNNVYRSSIEVLYTVPLVK